MRYVNYHKHTHYSNLCTLDSVCKPEDYIKRAVELGHTTYVTTEHGIQGNIFEAYTLCQKYGLKCVYGVEAYYADDMLDKRDRTSYHIVLIAMNKSGRKEINSILSKANVNGFYYKPRIDLNCLLSLTPKNVIVTSACVASRLFKGDDWEERFLIPVYNHFKENFYLEVQNHNADIQKKYNQKILDLKKKYNISLIHANDSHYIKPEDSKFRDLFIKAKGIKYPEESNFILDYPDTKTVAERYIKQGVLNKEQILEALNNTLIFEKAEDLGLDKEFKIPKINQSIIKKYLGETNIDISDDNSVLKELLDRAWKKEKNKIKPHLIPIYEKEIEYEFDIVKKCGMARYFILDHLIVNKAINEYNAVLTRSGRGSAVSFYINKLLGLTEVDRIKAPIKLYPTRFMSAERILNSKSLPDIDLNFASTEPVVQASKDILGEDGIYYMVAYKPLQESSAFRLWCKANGYNLEEYNEVAKNLESYVDDDKWKNVIEDSKVFRGVIESIAPSPCSYLLSSESIPEEIGLIKVGNEICCMLDGYNCDVYKYLKNDYLVVTVWDIISKTYKLIDKPIDDIATLVNNCDNKVWDIYKKGLTTTINQVDSDFAKPLVMKYKPNNLAELSAFVAAIRPAFSSLLNNFLNRLPYSTGITKLDDVLSDSFHYLLYQESIMSFLTWLGMEEKNTYDIIKKIAKKKFTEQELFDLQKQLIQGWIKNVGSDNGFKETWQVVQDAAHYSFNASHSLSVAIDSLYGAYLKANYPIEYFTVALSLYENDISKTADLISELPYFNISINNIRFGKSGADYIMDKKTNSIYKGISSIKYCNSQIAEELLELSKNKKYSSFIELLDDIFSKTSVNIRQLNILIGLNFFSDFGENQYLLNIVDLYNGIKDNSTKKNVLPSLRKCNQISKTKIEVFERFGISEYLIKKYSKTETAKQYNGIDNIGLLNEVITVIPNQPMSLVKQIKFEKEFLEYTNYANSKISKSYYIVIDFKTFKVATKPSVVLHNLNTGEEIRARIKQKGIYEQNPFGEFSVLKIDTLTYDYKVKLVNEKWTSTDELECVLTDYEVIKQ